MVLSVKFFKYSNFRRYRINMYVASFQGIKYCQSFCYKQTPVLMITFFLVNYNYENDLSTTSLPVIKVG